MPTQYKKECTECRKAGTCLPDSCPHSKADEWEERLYNQCFCSDDAMKKHPSGKCLWDKKLAADFFRSERSAAIKEERKRVAEVVRAEKYLGVLTSDMIIWNRKLENLASRLEADNQ